MRSERGASILLALLLFLVCAMVASVVLAASTAASGRLADLAATDRSYYAVTSAIELFQDQLADVEVSLEHEATQKWRAEVTEEADGTLVEGEPERVDEPDSEGDHGSFGAIVIEPADGGGEPTELCKYLTCMLVFGDGDATEADDPGLQKVWNHASYLAGNDIDPVPPTISEVSATLSMEASIDDDSSAKVPPVDVTIKVMPSARQATLTFTNKDEDADAKKVKMVMTLSADLIAYTDSEELGAGKDEALAVLRSGETQSIDYTVQYKETLYASVSWNVVSIE